ncbi:MULTISPECIES: DUF3857 and transglutaminase domain-containing protein [unclassified Flavobacterium]|uniref:DUF3857 domain-containing transglutaminase family protein n=1 Tax=unclassified Flavobacterium TaxID=196869 RepID=UPI001F13C9C8|nr:MULTISPECIES: DUF3857 and transglutaminase domain-containing protein [unclassified Flavobacterium]UMY65888.1 DUF3857 and transglutaminase domain-containing protein [Flavobacterium sp. HJ-32-4]
MYRFLFLFCLLAVGYCQAQEIKKDVASLPAELKDNANAVIRYEGWDIMVSSQRSMTIHRRWVVTVLNEEGLRFGLPVEAYSKSYHITSIEATLYDSEGKEVKSYRKKDFRDHSRADGFSLYTDDRVMYLPFTPASYPFTMEFESDVTTSNTAVIPEWSPLKAYMVSTEQASFRVVYDTQLGFEQKEVNFGPSYLITKHAKTGESLYTASNLKAIRYEDAAPEFDIFAPTVHSKVKKFSLEGVDGEAGDWHDFGRFMYTTMLEGSDVLTPETVARTKALVANETDPLVIARKIYRYVQDHTRYVNIAVGLGGFKPVAAKDVDRLGYGDCKALSNYTRALLKAVGIESYYTIVHADAASKYSLMDDFASVQGNHIILALPTNDTLLWLECTNQSIPFGFQGGFTDDRTVLIVKPEGGELVRTRRYKVEDNKSKTQAQYSLDAEGNLKGTLRVTSTGLMYDQIYQVATLPKLEQERFYKERFSKLNGVHLDEIKHTNDPDSVVFNEDISLTVPYYATSSGGAFLFPVNAFDQKETGLRRYRSRVLPFEITRGYQDEDEFTIAIPEGYTIETLPEPYELVGKFGAYHAKVSKGANGTLVYQRRFSLNEGVYDRSEYEAYRLFREQVAQYDAVKIVMSKKS